jgi:hypothetical protein
VVSDDNADRYRLNTGNDAAGQVVWGPAQTFSWPSGANEDDGFASQSQIVDLNRDGFNDVLISDVDVDIDNGGNRRLHIYHNRGNVPNVTLREEQQQSGGSGWKGVVGMTHADMLHTVHTAAFDLDRDGDTDIVLGRIPGDGGSNCGTSCTSVWINTLCRLKRFGTPTNNSTGLPGKLGWTGNVTLADNNLVLRATQLPANASGEFIVSEASQPCAAAGDGQRCVAPSTRRVLRATADVDGVAMATVNLPRAPFGATAGTVRYVQFRYLDPAGGPAGYNYTDAFDIKVCQ